MTATSTTYEVLTALSTGFWVPLFISVLSVTWLVGIMIKAMKAKDLVK